MKKWFLLFAVCFYALAFASPIQDRKIDPTALAQLAAAAIGIITKSGID